MYGKLLVLGLSIGIFCLLVFALCLPGTEIEYQGNIFWIDTKSIFFAHVYLG